MFGFIIYVKRKKKKKEMPLCWVKPGVLNIYSNNLQLFRDANYEQVFTLLKMCVILVG